MYMNNVYKLIIKNRYKKDNVVTSYSCGLGFEDWGLWIVPILYTLIPNPKST